MQHWDKQAKSWELIGPPLKPSDLDIQNYSAWIAKESHNKKLSVLVLGVTPEIIQIKWPDHTKLMAADCNLSMIQKILPAPTKAIAADWLKLPLPSASIDIVIGDGCYSSLSYTDYEVLTNEVHRVLKTTGVFLMRFFLQLDAIEPINAIQKDLYNPSNFSFHAFKLRLAMSLQDSLQQGVCLKNIWDCWYSDFKNEVCALKEKLNWRKEAIETIDNYKNSTICYTFPMLSEVRSVVSERFYEAHYFNPSYSLGERCPTLKLRPK